MNVFVTGCGKTGAALADRLSDQGHDVVVIDSDENKFENLSDNFSGLTFCGVSIDADVLVKAGIRDCDALCAASNDDNTNLMVAQLAKTVFGVEKVIVRVSDSEKEALYNSFGYNTICPTNLTVDSFVSAFGDFSTESSFTLRNHTIKNFSIPVPDELIGARALDITLDDNEILIAVATGNGTVRLVSNYNFVLNEGDTLIFSKLVD